MKKVLVIAAHPDDDILGCGGSIAFWRSKGFQIQVVFLTDGESSRFKDSIEKSSNPENSRIIFERKEAAKNVAKMLDTFPPIFLDFKDNQLDSYAILNVVKELEQIYMKFDPNIVVTHSASDLNIDHRRVHEAVLILTRPLNESVLEKVLFFEIPSSTEWGYSSMFPVFSPTYFIDIEKWFNVKVAALDLYGSEMRDFPHPRSIKNIEALSIWRGSCIGVAAAEAFEIGWIRIRE